MLAQHKMDSSCKIVVFVAFLIIRHPVLMAEQLRNVALGNPVRLSSMLTGYTQNNPYSAVDGRVALDINSCGCCVTSRNEQNPWLTVDLQAEYLVHKVVVIGRSDYMKYYISRSLQNLQMFNGNHTSTVELVPQMQLEMVNNTATARNLDQFLRHVTLKRPKSAQGEWYLTVCEIEIYVKECPSGQYGNGVCNKTCGYCKDGLPCDGVTGQCREGCDPGYVGNMCTWACMDGYYGNCSQMCGNCSKNHPCDHVTGRCPDGCSPGYKGDTCHDNCAVGYFGNCSQLCGNCTEEQSCDQVDGSCPRGCSPGYKGYTCHEECDPGQYGNNCSEMCGHCRRRQSCNHVTGFCPGSCGSGYRGDKCHEECHPGTYGKDCTQFCGQCFENEICHHINGTCFKGCTGDFYGILCKARHPKNGAADDQGSHMATVAVSVSVCAAAAAVTAIVTVRVMKRKRMLMSSRNESTYEVPVWHAHEDESAYSVLDNTHNLYTTDNTNT